MTDTQNTTTNGIDTLQHTATHLGVGQRGANTPPATDPPGVESPDAIVCTALGCHDRDELRRVTSDGRTRVLCPPHAVDFLGQQAGGVLDA